MSSENLKAAQPLADEIAQSLQAMIDAGHNPGTVADAALIAAISLRHHSSGPLMLAGILGTLCQRFRAESELNSERMN